MHAVAFSERDVPNMRDTVRKNELHSENGSIPVVLHHRRPQILEVVMLVRPCRALKQYFPRDQFGLLNVESYHGDAQ